MAARPELTPEEADQFLRAAVWILGKLDELERKPASAIPRDVMDCGGARVLLGALVFTIAAAHPRLVEGDDTVADLAAVHFRARN